MAENKILVDKAPDYAKLLDSLYPPIKSLKPAGMKDFEDKLQICLQTSNDIEEIA